ncbi:MAG: hypothetical protein ACRBCT_01655 [Alphaproteobacteria bacterium]
MDKEKKIAYYSACVNAFIQTRMEKNKQLLTLSALGIGLLASLREDIHNMSSLVLWFLSGFLFLASITLSLIIFAKNADYVLSDITEQEDEKKAISTFLRRRSKALDCMFSLAIFSTIIYIIYTADFSINILLEFKND